MRGTVMRTRATTRWICVCFLLTGFLLSWLNPTAALAQSAPKRKLRAATQVSDEEFSYIKAVRELRDGRVLAADWSDRDNRLVVVDFTRGVIERIGRKGDGPREFRSAGELHAMGADSTLFTDRMTRRWFVLVGAKILHTIPASRYPASVFPPVLQGVDTTGKFLSVRGFKFPSTYRSVMFAESLIVLRGRFASESLDTLIRIAGPLGPGKVGPQSLMVNGTHLFISNPLLSEDQVQLCRDGWMAVARVNPYSVEWFAPDGRRIRGEALPFTQIRIDEQQKRLALSMMVSGDLRFVVPSDKVHDWPLILPPFLTRALLCAPDGNLIVKRTRDARSNVVTYDVVDRKGRLVAAVQLPENEEIIGSGWQSVFVVATDSVGIQHLRRHPWP